MLRWRVRDQRWLSPPLHAAMYRPKSQSLFPLAVPLVLRRRSRIPPMQFGHQRAHRIPISAQKPVTVGRCYCPSTTLLVSMFWFDHSSWVLMSSTIDSPASPKPSRAQNSRQLSRLNYTGRLMGIKNCFATFKARKKCLSAVPRLTQRYFARHNKWMSMSSRLMECPRCQVGASMTTVHCQVSTLRSITKVLFDCVVR